MNPHFSDLLGTPYRREAENCLWTARRALERIFPDFAGSELPSGPEEEESAIAAINGGASRWRVVGESSAAASERGDLIHTRHADGSAGVAVVVDKVGMLAITSTPQHGAHLIPVRRITGVVAVLRRSK